MGRELPSGAQLEGEMDHLLNRPHDSVPIRRFQAVSPPVRTAIPDGMLLDMSPQLFHSGSVTRRSRSLQELAPTVAARLGPADARELGVENGETIRVVAGDRELLMRARLDRTVRSGTLVVAPQSGVGDGAAPLITEHVTPVTISVRRPR
jgi:anaerobic selenocysteine-containing dehydrogenase